MATKIPFDTTPEEFVRQQGWKLYKHQREHWIVLHRCPSCGGGRHGDAGTCIIHREDGNWKCMRASCGGKGTFWGLMLLAGIDPRNHIVRDGSRRAGNTDRQSQPAPYVYRSGF